MLGKNLEYLTTYRNLVTYGVPLGFLAHPTFYFIRFKRLFPLSVISNEASVAKYVARKLMQDIGKNAFVMLKVSPISLCLIPLWFSLLNKE